MRWFVVQDYFESLRPIYLASKACFVHFSTFDPGTGLAERTLFDLVRLILAVLTDVYLVTFAVGSLTLYLELTDSILLNGGIFASITLNFIFTTILPIWNSKTDSRLYRLYKNIAICDTELLNLGFSENHARHYLTSIVMFSCSMVMVVYLVTIFLFIPSFAKWLGVAGLFPSTWTALAHIRNNQVTGLFICQTTLTLFTLRKRFQLLNQVILYDIRTPKTNTI